MPASTTGTPSSPIASWHWRVVWLLFLATMLNYMDRQALTQTSRFLLDEFEVPADQRETVYGQVESAFAFSFAVFQLLAGFLVDRFSLRWLYLGALIVWSAAGCLTGLVPTGAIYALDGLPGGPRLRRGVQLALRRGRGPPGGAA